MTEGEYNTAMIRLNYHHQKRLELLHRQLANETSDYYEKAAKLSGEYFKNFSSSALVDIAEKVSSE